MSNNYVNMFSTYTVL